MCHAHAPTCAIGVRGGCADFPTRRQTDEQIGMDIMLNTGTDTQNASTQNASIKRKRASIVGGLTALAAALVLAGCSATGGSFATNDASLGETMTDGNGVTWQLVERAQDDSSIGGVEWVRVSDSNASAVGAPPSADLTDGGIGAAGSRDYANAGSSPVGTSVHSDLTD